MSTNNLKYIRWFAMVAFILAILSIGADLAADYNDSVRETQYRLAKVANGEIPLRIYGDWGDPRKWQRLILVVLTFVGGLLLMKPRTAIISTICYGTALFIYALWIRRIITIFSSNWNLFSDKSVMELLMLGANPFDFLLLGTVTVLFLTQLFMFVRTVLAGSKIRTP